MIFTVAWRAERVQRPGSWNRRDRERDRQVARARPPSCAKGVGGLAHSCKPLQLINVRQKSERDRQFLCDLTPVFAADHYQAIGI